MINNSVLMGRIVYPLQLKATANNVPYLRFTLAVDRDYQKSGGEKQTDFIPCVAWRNNAEFIDRYFAKGDMIAVEGSIQTQNYTDKNGNQRTSLDVLISKVSFCGSKQNSKPSEEEIKEEPTDKDFEVMDDDDEEDLPF